MHSAQFLGGLQVLPTCHPKGKGSVVGWENEKTPLKRKFPSYILHTIEGNSTIQKLHIHTTFVQDWVAKQANWGAS